MVDVVNIECSPCFDFKLNGTSPRSHTSTHQLLKRFLHYCDCPGLAIQHQHQLVMIMGTKTRAAETWVVVLVLVAINSSRHSNSRRAALKTYGYMEVWVRTSWLGWRSVGLRCWKGNQNRSDCWKIKNRSEIIEIELNHLKTQNKANTHQQNNNHDFQQ